MFILFSFSPSFLLFPLAEDLHDFLLEFEFFLVVRVFVVIRVGLIHFHYFISDKPAESAKPTRMLGFPFKFGVLPVDEFEIRDSSREDVVLHQVL